MCECGCAAGKTVVCMFFVMVGQPPKSTPLDSSAASDVYRGQVLDGVCCGYDLHASGVVDLWADYVCGRDGCVQCVLEGFEVSLDVGREYVCD